MGKHRKYCTSAINLQDSLNLVYTFETFGFHLLM
jgi:hypothetical protein